MFSFSIRDLSSISFDGFTRGIFDNTSPRRERVSSLNVASLLGLSHIAIVSRNKKCGGFHGAILRCHGLRNGLEFGRVPENRTHFSVNKDPFLNSFIRSERVLIYCKCVTPVLCLCRFLVRSRIRDTLVSRLKPRTFGRSHIGYSS